ncbi:hypothetical protein M427DRAFT_56828 [Gonapodya prolifera JEL478]|uniref:Uncharacterized protein n=1 Tax=Gonapodya prolifera (strain JEL478) TaxID=1344416 RepID=A0A139AFL4_GONPJ|nr:hypothetical protein M427DRAFT_56828 [Gonapodya prolifera JEL478]|eukprot:KXS15489.1 hypothetical protein M427DRAFT_56828 [Gonapodya prolifera JEL478]
MKWSDAGIGESALALAIIHGHWNIESYAGNLGWSFEMWDRIRWSCSFTFSNALSLAAAQGGKVTMWNGLELDPPGRDGRAEFNRKGGCVTY